MDATASRRGFFRRAALATAGVAATAAATFVPEPQPAYALGELVELEADPVYDEILGSIEDLQGLVLQMMANQAIAMQANVMLAQQNGFASLELPELMSVSLGRDLEGQPVAMLDLKDGVPSVQVVSVGDEVTVESSVELGEGFDLEQLGATWK